MQMDRNAVIFSFGIHARPFVARQRLPENPRGPADLKFLQMRIAPVVASVL